MHTLIHNYNPKGDNDFVQSSPVTQYLWLSEEHADGQVEGQRDVQSLFSTKLGTTQACKLFPLQLLKGVVWHVSYKLSESLLYTIMLPQVH